MKEVLPYSSCIWKMRQVWTYWNSWTTSLHKSWQFCFTFVNKYKSIYSFYYKYKLKTNKMGKRQHQKDKM